MNITFLSQLKLSRCAFLVVMLLLGSVSTAAANEYLGVLVEMSSPESEVAKQLNLTDEQREQLKQLINKRRSAAVGLVSQLKESPKSEHAQIIAAFAEQSERLGFDLLDEQQKAKLAKLRIQWLGLVSLSEPEVAKALNLADWQTEVVAEWRDKLRTARRDNNEDRVKPQADRAIRRELSDSQFAAWQVLAGQITENAAGAPMPPERKTADNLANSASPSDSATAGSTVTPEQAALMPVEEVQLTLNFQQQPWPAVIKWLAEQADLSVQTEVTPPGTFTYRDRSRKYSVSETLDIMNAYLLDSGYNLFRTDRLLRCTNFEEDQENRGELIKVLAEKVSSEEEFNRRQFGKSEWVRVPFVLKRLEPSAIKEEVEELLSIQGSVISLDSAGQLIVTDMAGNLRNVAEFLRRADDPNSARGASVQSISLKHVNAEEVLAVARPLLELQDGANVSSSIKISTNTFGTMIYAKGEQDAIRILQDLVEQMDKAPTENEKPISYETPTVAKHSVKGLDLQLAYEVSSQLLAGIPEVKLAKDEPSKSLILQARKAEHKLIEDTLSTLASQKSDFQVIQLQRLDPQMAIAAVKKFFGISDKADAASGQPVIDGDLMSRQLWVKGTEDQVERIRNLVEELEKNSKANKNFLGDNIRMLPAGSGSADAIRQAEVLWEQLNGKKNPVLHDAGDGRIYSELKSKTVAPPRKLKEEADKAAPQEASPEKSPAADSKNAKEVEAAPVKSSTTDSSTRSLPGLGSAQPFRLVSTQEFPSVSGDEPTQSDGSPPIIIRDGPGGLMITCDDTEVLERFENLLRMIMDQSNLGGDRPEVVYLQNIKAGAAKELLTDILSGSASSGAGGGGGLLGDMATNVLGGFGGGMLGSILGGGGGGGSAASASVGLASGEYSIVADPRLNALFISASTTDRILIDQILRVIDQPESPYTIETRGSTELIPVVTQDVADVLATVKSVFGDRIEGNASRSGGGAAGQPNPAEIVQAMRAAVGGGGGRRGAAGGNSELTEPKIAVSADNFTNTLIVKAQPQQINEVRELVKMIDAAGEGEKEEMIVVDLGKIGAAGMADSLKRVLGAKATTNTSGTNTTGGSTAVAGADADAARRRAEFFQTMMQQQRGQGGGGLQGFGGGQGGTQQRGGQGGGGQRGGQGGGGQRGGGR